MKRPQLTSCRSGRALLALPALAVLLAGCAIGPSGRAAGARPGQATQAADAAPLTAARPDNPNAPGFWYGTDSATIAITTKPPYREPAVSGSPPYGGYIGMAGNWARWSGCGGVLVWSSQDSKAANTNFNTYHKGIGTGVYWFMAGPGVDPHYNGTTAEASSWGAAQAAKTLRAIGGLNVTYKVVWMDIELPGDAPNYTPAQDNGWNNVYTSTCSGRIKTVGVAASLDRADLNGYASYLTAHSSYTPGVYSSPLIWSSIFGTGSASSIPQHRRMDLHRRHQEHLAAADRLVRAAHLDLRPLLRRGDQFQRARGDVAVVGRRRADQRCRRLRPDRHQPRELTQLTTELTQRASATRRGPAAYCCPGTRSAAPLQS